MKLVLIATILFGLALAENILIGQSAGAEKGDSPQIVSLKVKDASIKALRQTTVAPNPAQAYDSDDEVLITR
jgi:hypothetical protein